MKHVILFLTLMVIGSFAQADAGKIKYGRDLCEVVSFRNATQRACENWVIDNSDSGVYSIALNACIKFNQGPLARTADCFTRASKWIDDQDVRDQTDLCKMRNGNYNPRAECLRNLYFKKNSEENQRIREYMAREASQREQTNSGVK